MSKSAVHQTHPEVLNRLRRASGHLATVISMIENGNPCTPTAQQLHAVVRALENAKRIYVQEHIDHCITVERTESEETSEMIRDLKEIVKYL